MDHILQHPDLSQTSERRPDPIGVKMRTEDLHAYFGKVRALQAVSVEIPVNRVLAIIGPSGCGKSTFLRCLNRMHEVAGGRMTGTIELDAKSILDLDPVQLRRRVGM